MNWAAITWAGLLILFLIVEAACPVHLISIWFAAGSLIAAVAAWLGWPIWLQLTLFTLISGALLVCLWPLTKKWLNPGHTATNLDSVIGSCGVVTAAVDNVRAVGQVKLGAMEWSARSTSGDPIPVDTQVRVDKIEGVKVLVSPVEITAAV